MGNEVCLSCGACCAHLRVGFAEWETDRKRGTVPFGLTEPWIPNHRRMRGTASEMPRCAALEGVVGKSTTCGIYGNHPSPCRELAPSTPEAPNPYCDEARIAHGLPPLSEGGRAHRPKRQPHPAPAAEAHPAPPPPQPTPPQPEPAPEPAAAPPPPAEGEGPRSEDA